MALALGAHGQCGVHVNVVTGEIQADESLEDDAPSRPGGGQEDEEAGGGAAVRHHVEHCAEGGGLVVASSGHAVERVKEAGYRVEEGACSGVQWHVVERGDGEDDARVA